MVSMYILIIVSSLLGTQLISPFFIVRFFQGLSNYHKQNGKKKQPLSKFIKFELCYPVRFYVIQFLFFGLGIFIFSLWYILELPDFTFSEFLATAWLIGLIHLCCWGVSVLSESFGFSETPYLLNNLALFFGTILFLLSLIFNIASGCYGFSHQAKANTFIKEAEIPVVSIDVLESLEKETVLKGYSFGNAVYRDGRVIIPMYREENVEIAGYVEIKDNLTPQIVMKTLRYTPYISSTYHPMWVAREAMPNKIFFGGWSFQLTPEGDVYFVRMYGKFAWLRGGREIEGIAMVNGETGELSTCSVSDAPAWIEGLSE